MRSLLYLIDPLYCLREIGAGTQSIDGVGRKGNQSSPFQERNALLDLNELERAVLTLASLATLGT